MKKGACTAKEVLHLWIINTTLTIFRDNKYNKHSIHVEEVMAIHIWEVHVLEYWDSQGIYDDASPDRFRSTDVTTGGLS